MKCIGKFLKFSTIMILTVSLLTGCQKINHKLNQYFPPEDVTAAYEAENYSKESLYRGSLYAKELCVTDENIEMDGGPDTAGIYSAALFDVDGADVDFAYNVHERVYPASTTKIMTALIAIQNADLNDRVTVSANADSESFAADESVCELKEGDQLTLSDLLYGLLLQSGNDNAVAIAEHVAGSSDAFVEMMNAEAQRLMATNTHFVNSNGLHDENHYTTAYDLYLIFNECIKYDAFLEIIGADTYTADITGADGTLRQVTWEPTNFYASGEAELPQNATVIGGKTGTTKAAGNCLILLEKDPSGRPYISVVMGADTKPLLYQDMTALINGITSDKQKE